MEFLASSLKYKFDKTKVNEKRLAIPDLKSPAVLILKQTSVVTKQKNLFPLSSTLTSVKSIIIIDTTKITTLPRKWRLTT